LEPTSPPPDAPPAPRGRKSALAFFGVVLALFLPGIFAQTLQPAAGLLWTELFVFLLAPVALASGSNLDPRAFLALRPVRPGVLGLGVLVGGAGTVVAMAVMAGAQRFMPRSWLETFDVARLFEGSPATRVAVALVATFVAPACEEISFRGYAESALLARYRPAVAIAGSALLFSLIHLDPVRFPAVLVLGAVFAWLRWRSGSVWPAAVAHATNNGIVSLAELSASGARPSPADVEAVPLPAVALGLAIGVSALVPLAMSFRTAAGAPPDATASMVLRDPADPSLAFRPSRLPRGIRLAVVLGAQLLLVLALVALWRARAR
jgi:CAAX protease family protein